MLATLSNAHRMLDDIPAAAAAMEAPAGLDPSNGDLTENRIRLYRAPDAPAKAARAFRKTLGGRATRAKKSGDIK
ncbi:MAG: hypothetical protein GY859_40230 [Desulfobacterales bacterium]|nr:hypothetical protein [Desulfobacterales bacterium]